MKKYIFTLNQNKKYLLFLILLISLSNAKNNKSLINLLKLNDVILTNKTNNLNNQNDINNFPITETEKNILNTTNSNNFFLNNVSVSNDNALLNNHSQFSQILVNSTKDTCLPKVDLVFLLDTSGSIEKIYQEHVRWAVALVESLPIEEDTVRVAAVQYSNFPLTEFALGTYPNANDIRQHLNQINFQSGVTRTGYALRKAEAELFRNNRGARNDAKKVIVLFTDGLSIDDPLKPAQQLRDLKGVVIYVVSVGNEKFAAEMNRIAGSRGNVFGSDNLPRLRDILITEAQRAQACSRVGDKLSEIYQQKALLSKLNTFKFNKNDKNLSDEDILEKVLNNCANSCIYKNNNVQSNSNVSIFLNTTKKISIETMTKNYDLIIYNNTGIKKNVIAKSSKTLKSKQDYKEDNLSILPKFPNFTKDFTVLNPFYQWNYVNFTNITTQNFKNITSQTKVYDHILNNNKKNEQKEFFKKTKFGLSVKKKIETQIETGELADVFEVNNKKTNVLIDKGITQYLRTTKKTFVKSSKSFNKTKSNKSKKNFSIDNKNFNSSIYNVLSKTTSFKNFKNFQEFLSAQKPIQTSTIKLSLNNNKTLKKKFFLSTRQQFFTTPNINSNIGKYKQRSTSLKKNTTTTLLPVLTKRYKYKSTIKQLFTFTPIKSLTNITQQKKILTTIISNTKYVKKLITTKQPKNKKNLRLFGVDNKQKNASLRFITDNKDLFTITQCPIDWLFIVDSSGSVQKIYNQQKNYLNNLLQEIHLNENNGHRIALLQFAGSEVQKMEWSFNQFLNQNDLMNAFKQVRLITGTTYIGAALEAALRVLETRRQQTPSIIVLLSDGFSQDDSSQAAEKILHQPNSEFYALSIAELSNEKHLAEIVGQNKNVFVGLNRAEKLYHILLERLHCKNG